MDRRYLSSNYFQRCEQSSNPVPKRVWNIDHSGESQRVKELHSMLIDKKAPYSAQVEWAAERADEARKEKAEAFRIYNAKLDQLRQKLDQEVANERERTRERDRVRKKRGHDNTAALNIELKTKQDDYREFRRQLDVTVGQMPPLCGDPPPSTLKDRPLEKRIKDGLQKVNSDTRLWFQSMKSLKDHLHGQIEQPIRRVASDTIIEQRKEAGLSGLNQQLRKYCDFLTTTYDVKDMAMHQRMEKDSIDYQNHLAHMSSQNALIHQGIKNQKEKYKTWRAGMEHRIKTRPNSWGGYVPVVQSKKRLAMSAIFLESDDTSKSGSMSRTMRPASGGGD